LKQSSFVGWFFGIWLVVSYSSRKAAALLGRCFSVWCGGISGAVNRAFVVKGPQYPQMFAWYGISREKADGLIKHAEKIHQAAMEAEAGIKQALQARNDFKKRLKENVTPEDFAHFENFGKSDQARYEVEQLQKYFADNGKAPLSSDQVEQLASLIQATGAYIDLLPHMEFSTNSGPWSSGRKKSPSSCGRMKSEFG
jgi:hypothetical protein